MNIMNVVLPFSLKVLRQIAADADVDSRTAARAVLGLPCRPACRERVVSAMTARGIDPSKLPQMANAKGAQQ
jgi:hypothetical protein